MTLRTSIDEMRLMRIIVAGFAIGMGHIIERLELLAVPCGHRMALLAIHRNVLATEFEIGLVVIEGTGRFERIHSMAVQALGRHGSLVPVIVTWHARLVQS